MTTLPPIALCGFLRSGKDAAAAYLVERYGYTRFAFGDGIRKYAHQIFPWVPRDPKPRSLYQFFNVMREYDDDVWIRHCFDDILYSRICPVSGDDGILPVITDCRQPNEIARCRAEGFAIIRVNAPEALRIHRAIESADTFKLSDLTHSTESHVAGFSVDYEIENSGTLAELYVAVDAIMARLTR